jgi:hypothetical protein
MDRFSMTKPIVEIDLSLDLRWDGTDSESRGGVGLETPEGTMITVLFPVWIGEHPLPILIEVQVPSYMKPKRSKSQGHADTPPIGRRGDCLYPQKDPSPDWPFDSQSARCRRGYVSRDGSDWLRGCFCLQSATAPRAKDRHDAEADVEQGQRVCHQHSHLRHPPHRAHHGA